MLWRGRTKQQGERLQRQVLQYLSKEKAHPAMISTVAANLVDMLWEQNKLEEAEATLYQAREVPPCPLPLFCFIIIQYASAFHPAGLQITLSKSSP